MGPARTPLRDEPGDQRQAPARLGVRPGVLAGRHLVGCVEVARNLPGVVAVRDSKDPEGPALTVSPARWDALVEGIKHGDFDL